MLSLSTQYIWLHYSILGVWKFEYFHGYIPLSWDFGAKMENTNSSKNGKYQ